MTWSFHSHAQLVQAGYRFQTEISCSRCGARVLLYVAPKGYRMTFERESFVPHSQRCSAKRSAPAGQSDLFGGNHG